MAAAIFDPDGTLVDLIEVHYRGFKHVVKDELGLDFKREDLRPYYGEGGALLGVNT